jgi:hypothetical protein
MNCHFDKKKITKNYHSNTSICNSNWCYHVVSYITMGVGSVCGKKIEM